MARPRPARLARRPGAAPRAGGATQRGAGAGSKGERWYDWQCRVLVELEDAEWGHYLLFRRSCTDPDDWQAYVAFAPRDCDPGTIVGVAGSRRHIESAFEAARQETVPGQLRGAQRARLVPAPDAGAVGLSPAGRGAGRRPGPPGPQKRVPDRASGPGPEPARDPPSAVAAGPASAARGAVGAGLVPLAPPPAAPQTATNTTVVLGGGGLGCRAGPVSLLTAGRAALQEVQDPCRHRGARLAMPWPPAPTPGGTATLTSRCSDSYLAASTNLLVVISSKVARPRHETVARPIHRKPR